MTISRMTKWTGLQYLVQAKAMNMKFGKEKQKEEYYSITNIKQRFYEQMSKVIIGFRDRRWAPVSVKCNAIVV